MSVITNPQFKKSSTRRADAQNVHTCNARSDMGSAKAGSAASSAYYRQRKALFHGLFRILAFHILAFRVPHFSASPQVPAVRVCDNVSGIVEYASPSRLRSHIPVPYFPYFSSIFHIFSPEFPRNFAIISPFFPKI